MAATKKRKQKDLVDTLRARGLRKRVAKTVADAVHSSNGKTPKVVSQVADELKGLAAEIEDRATGRTAKRKAAGRKAASTRARNARKRSTAAKKAARTRAKAR